MLKPHFLFFCISPETTNELLEIAHLSMARTKSTTGCSSASDFILLEAFDADLKAPSSVWNVLWFKNLLYVVLFTGVFCNARHNAMRVFQIHMKATETNFDFKAIALLLQRCVLKWLLKYETKEKVCWALDLMNINPQGGTEKWGFWFICISCCYLHFWLQIQVPSMP